MTRSSATFNQKKKMLVTVTLIVHGPVILPYILNSIWWMNVILLENVSLTSK